MVVLSVRLVDADDLVEEAFGDDVDEDAIDAASVVAIHLMHGGLEPDVGILYRGTRFVRARTDYLAINVYHGSDGRIVDRILPRQFASARALGAYLDRIATDELDERPPLGRFADHQAPPHRQ